MNEFLAAVHFVKFYVIEICSIHFNFCVYTLHKIVVDYKKYLCMHDVKI